MKKLFFLMALAMMSVMAYAQRPLITKWYASSGVVKFRVIGGGTYTWEGTTMPMPGTGSTTVTGSGSFTSGLVTINVPTNVNQINLSITPTNTFRFIFENSGLTNEEVNRFSEISQWGDVKWNPALTNMFYNCYNLKITATDIPNFSNVTDMSGLFYGCRSITTIPNIGKWDTSSVTNMSKMFLQAQNFNGDLSGWDTSAVTNMSQMFYDATKFNSDISKWNTGKVTNMAYMFQNAKSFNQPLAAWNTANVTSMHYMFYGATVFNQPLAAWNTANVTSMNGMFYGATVFNQPIANWNTGKVTSMSRMFYNADAFNQPLNTWDVSNVTNMSSMFYNASKFNQPLDQWNVSKVYDFNSMFYNASAFNQNIGMWKLFSATDYYWKYVSSMLNNSGLDCINYGKTLQGWSSLNFSNPYKLTLGAQNLTYGTAAKPYRDALIAKGWTITGDYLDPDCNATLAIKEAKLSGTSLQVYPNPTSGLFKIKTTAVEVATLYDYSGKLLKTQKLSAGENTMDISNLQNGIYLIKVGNDTSKIIKK